jgi:hypothetical protein
MITQSNQILSANNWSGFLNCMRKKKKIHVAGKFGFVIYIQCVNGIRETA